MVVNEFVAGLALVAITIIVIVYVRPAWVSLVLDLPGYCTAKLKVAPVVQ